MLVVLLLLLGTATHAIPLQPLAPVRLEIADRNFVHLLLGTPPRYYAFYLSVELSDIEFHNPQIESQSHSGELLQGQGTELFYLGAEVVRLPFVSVAPLLAHSVHLTSSLTASGTLGLGPRSPLWRYWHNFTLTRETLLLGAYDVYLQMDSSQRPPAFPSGAGLCWDQVGAASNPFVLDFSSVDTLLPHHLFESRPQQLVLKAPDGSCGPLYAQMRLPGMPVCSDTGEIPLRTQQLPLLTGIEYQAVQRSHDDTVHFGRRFLQDFVLFCDWRAGALVFAESATSFHSSELNAVFTVLLLTMSWLWIALAFNRPKGESYFARLLVHYLEALIFLTVLCSWTVNFIGFRWARFVAVFLRAEPTALLVYLHATVGLCCGAGIVGLVYYTWIGAVGQRSQLPQRSLFILNSVLPTLWSSFLPRHHFGSDVLFLLFFATALCIFNGVLLLQATLERRLPVQLLAGAATLLSYAFLFWGNLRPLHHQSTTLLDLSEFTLAYLGVACVFPTTYLFVRTALLSLQQKPEPSTAATGPAISAVATPTLSKAIDTYYYNTMGSLL